MENTQRIRSKGGFKKGVSGNNSKKFTGTMQPTGAAKSLGKQKKKFTRMVLAELLEAPYKFTADCKIKKELIAAFGEGILKMPIGKLMGLQQAQKAILKGDSTAFMALINQALGLPAQPTELTGKDGKDLSPIIFIPADSLTDEQLEKYLNETNNNDKSQ